MLQFMGSQRVGHDCVTDLRFPDSSVGKESNRRPRFYPWVRKILWRKEWLTAPVFLPGKSHGQRTLVGYSPRSCKESDTTE